MEGGRVELAAAGPVGVLVVEVVSPGVLREGSDSTGVGLRNTRDRLELLFGREAGLVMRQDTPERVVARLTVPQAARRERRAVA